ncbi:MAG: DNRLRE domain-containing protein [Candidatus Omnitrophica bacterium]|nr:DNRLRE domain-containing protein [Candidatus Omnitrophota bacterium]
MLQISKRQTPIAGDVHFDPEPSNVGDAEVLYCSDWDPCLFQADLSQAGEFGAAYLWVKSKEIIYGGEFSLFAVLHEWDEMQATADFRLTDVPWDGMNMLAGSDYRAAAEDAVLVEEAEAWRKWDITALMQEWISGALPNYGMVLRGESGSPSVYFHSSEAVDETNRPYIETELITAAPTRSRTVILGSGFLLQGQSSRETRPEQRFEFTGKGDEPINILDAAGAPVFCDPASVRLYVNGILWPTSHYTLEQGNEGTILTPHHYVPDSPDHRCSVFFRPRDLV